MQFLFNVIRVSHVKQFGAMAILFTLLITTTCVYSQAPEDTPFPFDKYIGYPLVNTNGNWVVNSTAAPNDINTLETQIRTMPAKGLGIMGVEVRLLGADGGTATFKDAFQTQLGQGGEGASVLFTCWLNNLTYSKPFYIAFGKHGQSTSFFGGSYTAAGGGGSTGMSWLSPGATPHDLFYRSNTSGELIATAGGGGGGLAAPFVSRSGKGGGTPFLQVSLEDIAKKNVSSCGPNNNEPGFAFFSGGSRWDYHNSLAGTTCSGSHLTYSYSSTVVGGGAITAIYAGQGGGQPYYESWKSQQQGVIGGTFSIDPNCVQDLASLGGAGGSGLYGGGAGGSSSTLYVAGENYPGGGGGGTGDNAVPGTPASDSARAGWGGYNHFSYNMPGFSNVVFTAGNSTTTPQSGAFFYRTIRDSIPPVAVVDTGIITVSLRLIQGNANAALQALLPTNTIHAYATDNDSVKTLTFTKSTFTCGDVGQIIKVRLIATDFAGNVDTSDTELRVLVTDAAPPKIPSWPLSGPVKFVNIGTGPYTVTQNDFPVATDNCSGAGVTYSWSPRTFSCADLGGTFDVNYTVTDLYGNWAQYVQRFIIISSTQSSNIYVDASATGANNGSSWTDAFTNLQDAYSNVCNDHRNIYIAAGTYYPDRGAVATLNDRSATFTLRDGDKLYGGFPSGGTVFSARDPKQNITILSGNINNNSSSADNSYHVVTIPAGVNKILLEGVTITDGRADENASSFGGAIKLLSAFGDSLNKVTIKNCGLEGNYAAGNGGAVGFPNIPFVGMVTAINSFFTANAAGGNGGVLYSSNLSAPSFVTADFTNCTFLQNTAAQGGALYFQNTSARLTNCSSGYNKAATSGGVISSTTSNVHVRNTILWGDTAGNAPNEIGAAGQCNFTYSNIQGSGGSGAWNANTGINNGMNIDANPQYLSFPPLVIPPSSPCRNAGLKSLNNAVADLAGAPRVVQDTIDMGAYEINPIVYVAADAANGGDGNSWATALNNLNSAIDSAHSNYYLKDIWIKRGTYRPDRGSNGTDQGRFNAFYLTSSEKLYGGFAGNETTLSQRNIAANPTVLDGDIGIQNDTSDNAYHVIMMDGIFPGLDGLILQHGNANHTNLAVYQIGGAVYSNASTAVVRNCVFRNNSANSGGAVSVTNSSADCNFTANQCLFYNNYAKFFGGAIYVQNGGNTNINVACNLYNCTAAGNIANGFGGGFVEAININGTGTAATNIYNSTLWGNYINQNGLGTIAQETHNTNSNATTNTYSSYVGGADAAFVNISNPAGTDGMIMTGDDGLALLPYSPAINIGDTAYIPQGITTDITGANARILQGVVDAGAYENFGCPAFTALYVDSSVTESGAGGSWSTAYKYLSDAIKTANKCPLIQNIFIARGTYYPNGTNDFWASRDTAFYISQPYNLYGGYPNGGGARNVSANRVTLTGDINSTTSADNAYHIMIVKSGTADTTILDGLTFTNGNASQNGNYTLNGTTYSRSSGGAVVSNTSKLHINNCTFKNNYAFQGGAAVYSTGGTVASTRSVFESNTARYGGAMRIEGTGTTPVANLNANVFYKNNSLANGGGGAISFLNGGYTVTNNLFAYDSCALQQGGAINVTGGKSYITGNTFFKNFSVADGGALSLTGTTDTQLVANNIFYRNTDAATNAQFYTAVGVISNSVANTINGNPQFVDTANLQGEDGIWATLDDGLVLKRVSSFINTGSNNYASGTNDIAGALRTQFGTVDPGAYEGANAITRWYVSAAQDTAEQDGTSWTTAFQKFEDGVNAAKPGDSVWVATGTYTPASGASFGMKAKVKIFGGFAANETTLAQRNLSNGYNTVLNGNNASVVVNNDVDTTALLDGFIIKNGNAVQGGGMLNTNSSPLLRNLVFEANNATGDGGAVALYGSQPQIQNVVFYNNTSGLSGGAIYNNDYYFSVINATFYKNTAALTGGAIRNSSGFPIIGNCIFYDNSATNGADVYSTTFANISYSMLQTANTGVGNIIGLNPFFATPTSVTGYDGLWFTGDDGLQPGYLSAALNHGSNAIASGIAGDITGAARLQNGTVDMGAYESAYLSFCDSAALKNQSVLYVDGSRAAGGDGSNWQAAYRTLNEALERANYCTVIDTILVAKGNYYPTGYQGNTDRSASFTILRNGLNLLGGYPNGGGDRDPAENNTFLNGDIGMEGMHTDNSCHVVTFAHAGQSSLDGFIITNGSADSILQPFNSGGGIYNDGSVTGISQPVISNCVFSNNKAIYGAGIYNNGFGNGGNASAVITNCVFTCDTASTDGGAIYNNGRATGKASPLITNCTFSRNHAANNGGGIYDAGISGTCATKIVNSILWNNTAVAGNAVQKQVYNDNATDTASYSLFQNGVPTSVYNGGQNISTAPLFAVDSIPAGYSGQWMHKYNGLALRVNSPGVQAGNNTGAPGTDITGASRQSVPDMGAYQNNCGGTGAITQNVTACDSIVSPGYHYMWRNSGTYNDTLFNVLGCDTTYSVTLTIHNSAFTSQTANACGHYQSPSGLYTWDSTGVYYDTLQTVSGCDSVISVSLTIAPFSDSASVSGAVCTAQQTGASYQWFNCANGQPVSGATSQAFTATQNGSYKCAVISSHCADTTNCVSVTGVGINEAEPLVFALNPNPNNGTFTVRHNYSGALNIAVMDALGRKVAEMKLTEQTQQFDLAKLAAGSYYLLVTGSKDEFKVVRFVKQ